MSRRSNGGSLAKRLCRWLAVIAGAGAVLRCPACGDVAMRIGINPDRYVVILIGELTLQAPAR